MFFAWAMIIVGVVVTAIQTHGLALTGMKGSKLYDAWLSLASWLPVFLLVRFPDERERQFRRNVNTHSGPS